MKALVKLAVAAVIVAGVATTASAGLVGGFIPSGVQTNDFLGILPGTTANTPIGGWYGGQLYLSGGPATVTVEWFGGEAGYQNEFYWGSTLLFHHPGGNNITGGVVGSTSIPNVLSGLLNFSFKVNGGPDAVTNGSNTDNQTPGDVGPNFFVTFDLTNTTIPGGARSGQAVWIFFDDGGFSNDDNHDDMLIRLSVRGGEFSVVPEPGSMLLLGSGLAALLMRRRR